MDTTKQFKMRNTTILAILCLLGSYFARARTVTVCPTCSFSGIKQAVAAAQAGDVVLVKKGTYREYNIELNKPLTLKG